MMRLFHVAQSVIFVFALLLPVSYMNPPSALVTIDISSSGPMESAQTSLETVAQATAPLFTENVGQSDDGARFLLWGGGSTWLVDDAEWITI